MKKGSKSRTKLEDANKRLPRVVCIVKSARANSPYYLLVRFSNIDKKRCSVLMPAIAVARQNEAQRFLIDQGFPYNRSQDEWRTIHERLKVSPRKRAFLVMVPGWHGTTFLFPSGECRHPDGVERQHYLDPSLKLRGLTTGKKGTVEEWVKVVNAWLPYSSRLVLAVCAAFSGTILRISGLESGGFHFHGTSSQGKSLCLRAALSLSGRPSPLPTWDTTASGLEDVARSSNDGFVILDESNLAGQTVEEISRKLTSTAYQLASVAARSRSTLYQSAALQDEAEWCISILSSGNQPVAGGSGVQSTTQTGGGQVRLIDIPGDAGHDLGIFERRRDNARSSKMAHGVERALSKQHGTAGRAFIDYVANAMHSDGAAFQKKIRSLIGGFVRHLNVDGDDGMQSRMAKRFGLAFAAGMLARECGLLTLSKEQLRGAITTCHEAAMKSRPVPIDEAVTSAVEKIIRHVNAAKCLDLRKVKDESSQVELQQAVEFKTLLKGEPIRALRTAPIEKLIDNDVVRRAALLRLASRGILIKSADGKNTRQISGYKEGGKPVRMYCFRNPKGR